MIRRSPRINYRLSEKGTVDMGSVVRERERIVKADLAFQAALRKELERSAAAKAESRAGDGDFDRRRSRA